MNHRRLSLAVLSGLLLDLVNRVAPLLIIRHAQAALELAGFGAAQYLIAVFETLQTFVTFGFVNFALARIGSGGAADDDGAPRSLFANLAAIKVINAAVVLGIYHWAYAKTDGSTLLLAFILAANVCDSYWLVIARHKLGLANLLSGLLRIVSLLLIIGLVRTPADGRLFMWLTILPNALLSLGTGVYALRRLGLATPSFAAMRRMLVGAAPFALVIALGAVVDRADLFLVEHWFGVEIAGIYAGPYKVVQSLTLLLGSLALPFYAEALHVKDRDKLTSQVATSLWFLMSLVAPMTFGIPAIAADVRSLLFSQSPPESAGLLSLLGIGLIFSVLTALFGVQILLMRSRPWVLIRVFAAALAALGVGTWLLASDHGFGYGYKAVAIVAVAAKALVGLYCAKHGLAYLTRAPWRAAVKPLAAGVVMGGCLRLTQLAVTDSPLLIVPVGAVVYVAALLALSRREVLRLLAHPKVRATWTRLRPSAPS